MKRCRDNIELGQNGRGDVTRRALLKRLVMLKLGRR